MLFALIFLTVWFSSPATNQEEGNWKLKRDRDNITIHVREQPGSPLKEYRARAVIHCPIHQVYAFISDVERHPEWVFRCTDLTIIDRAAEHRLRYHTSYDIPWPLKDRDLTVEVVFSGKKNGSRMESLTQHISLDYPKVEGVIRMPGYREWVMLEEIDTGSTLFITEGYADPGGKVPAWLVNMFLVDGIYNSVEKARDKILMANE